MCGGMLLTIPCSRVGFIYALESPVLNPKQIRNRIVIAESLMDDYKGHFYNAHSLTNRSVTAVVKQINTSIESTKKLRQDLHCKPFGWFMFFVFYDKKEPRVDSQYGGLVCHSYSIRWHNVI